jgi:hypothetical protein
LKPPERQPGQSRKEEGRSNPQSNPPRCRHLFSPHA